MANAIGATAISTVIRSASMCCSIRSMSNRRCSRIHTPVCSAVTMLSKPEDVRRRCGDLNSVAGGQTQRVAPVPNGGVQRRVGVPDGLRQTGRARAERQHRIGIRRGGEPNTGSPGADRLVEMQHRHQIRQHRMVADGVRRIRQCQRVLDLVALPGRADQHDGRRPAARWHAARRRTRAGWMPSTPPARPAVTPRPPRLAASPSASALSCAKL